MKKQYAAFVMALLITVMNAHAQQQKTSPLTTADRTSHPIVDPTIVNPPAVSGTPGLITVIIQAGVDGVEATTLNVVGTDAFGLPFQFSVPAYPPGFMVPVGSSGTVTPTKDDNPLNGVTTYDIVLIGKHWRGQEPFNSPRKWVAADANRDNIIDAQDSIEQTKLILGIYQHLPNNTSWRFIPKTYVFPDVNPLSQPYPESFTFTNIQEHLTVEFQGIKIGDVNDSAVSNGLVSDDDKDHARETKTVTPADRTAPGATNPSFILPRLDQVAPSISCLNGLSVNLMPTQMISLWASDFLLYASDDDTPTDQLRFGIRKSGTGIGFPWGSNFEPVDNVIFDCDEQGPQSVELWVIDMAGNASYCETPLLIQDNNLNCGGNSGLSTLCLTKYCDQEGVEEASMLISGSSPFVPPFYFDLSNGIGCWDIPNNIPASMVVSAEKDDNPLYGVTSYDLELLSQHIHGIQPFTEPWQWIAADANRDNVVDIQDSIEFRKLLLGNYLELPQNTSWRFTRSDYVFPEPNPLSMPIPASFTIEELVNNPGLSFLGIKIGNLSCGEPRPGADRNAASTTIISAAISPNPTTEGATLTLQLLQPKSVQVQLHDLSGRLIIDVARMLPAGNQTIDIPATVLPYSGVYIWSVQTDEARETGKLVRN